MTLLRPAVRQNGVFQNPVPTTFAGLRQFPRLFSRLVFGKEERVPRRELGPFRTDTTLYTQPPASGLRITLLGHSSLLVEIDGTTLLIDPVFSERASFSQRFGPKRFYPPPLGIHELPPLSAVLLTHDHYDHLDRRAVQSLAGRTPLFITSQGVGTHLRRWGITTAVHELNWMDELLVPSAAASPTKLIALPARHFSGRSLKRFQTLWSSFALQSEHHSLYHGADSGYFAVFKEIGDRFGPFDLAMLEIGAFDPMWSDIHLGPDNAIKATRDLRAEALMPIHWGLFNLAFHPWYQPAERITELAAAAGLPLLLPRPGTPFDFDRAGVNSLWWRSAMS